MKQSMMVTSLLYLLLLTGCWSSRELTDLAITTALGIDFIDDQYVITAQILNPDEIAGQNVTTRVATNVYSAHGTTMFEAIRRLTTVAPRKLYLGHIRMVIFSEDYAKHGIGGSLDFISRDHEMRTDFLFTVVRGYQAKDAVKILTPLERISANKMYTSLEASQESWAPTKVVQLDELISSMSSEGREAVLTGLYINGDPEEGAKLSNVERSELLATLETNHLGVFKSDQLVGWLTEDQSKGFNYITNNITNTVDWTECDGDGKITLEIMNANTSLDAKVKGGKPIIMINTDLEANIADVECKADIMSDQKITEIEENFNKKIKQIMQGSVDQAKQVEADIFGFGELIQQSQYKSWKEMKDNWSTIFSKNLEVDIKVKTRIEQSGTITQPFYQMIEDKKEKDGMP